MLLSLLSFEKETRARFQSPNSKSMVSRKASAPKRAAATQKLSKKAATATEKAKEKAKATSKKTNAVVKAKKSSSEPGSASALAVASTSGSAGAATNKHSDRGKVLYVG